MVFPGYSGFIHQFQLASHDLATIWQKKSRKTKFLFQDALQQQQQFQDPQDLPAPPAELLLDDEYEPPRYQNQGLILNPRRYASADHIHSLFTGGGKAPQTYITNKAPKTASKTNSGAGDKGNYSNYLVPASEQDKDISQLANLNESFKILNPRHQNRIHNGVWKKA